MVGFRELGWRLAAPDRLQPLHLLSPELGVVRDKRQRRPAGRIAWLSLPRLREQQLLLHRGEAHQPGYYRSQRGRAGHAAPCCWAASGLRAMNFSDQSTITVISEKPSV